jgi:tetratricopeptide (TPR) repeat protein
MPDEGSGHTRWRKIEELYNSALERPKGRRAAYLADACDGDAELEQEVASLIAESESSDGFLDSPAVDVAAGELARSVSASARPSNIGRYRIIRLVGEGGMGVVYEAEQEDPRRIVALKMLRFGLATPDQLRRFRRESQALARLQHPGIAQIYESDTADTGFGPQPYFAMELIHGVPLDEYAQAHRLGTRQRLMLMVKVSEAVHHAHQRGLIHRDLKPGNILVDETGQPKILDFGVARLVQTDAPESGAPASFETGLGQLVGTLAYMSPEQVLGDPLEVDIRSDVYSLGVILYQLLSGRLPYDVNQRQLPDAVCMIREQEPADLSTIDRAYRGDIETIVRKALEKDKARRYASAAELGADIQRYLDDEPIAARPPSTTYQLKKFVRRHRGLMAAVAAVFLVLVAGIVVSAAQANRARRERDRAVEAQAAAKAISDFLQNDLLAQASAATQAGPSVKPDPHLEVRTALDRAAARIEGKFGKQPEMEAAIRNTIGETYLGLGLYPEARTQLERALELRRRVLGPEDPATLQTMNRLGNTGELQGKYPEAEALFSQVLKTQRRLLGPEHTDTLSSMDALGHLYDSQGKYAEAENLLRQTLEISRRVLGREDPRTLSTMSNLAYAYHAQGKNAQAIELFGQTVEIERRVLGPEHPGTLGTMNSLAEVYREENEYARAEAIHSQTLEIRHRVLGPEHPSTLGTMNNLAIVYKEEGKYAQAEALDRQTLEIKRRVLGPEHPSTLGTMNNLALVYVLEGQYARAKALLDRTLEIKRRVLGPEHPSTLNTLSTFGFMYQLQGEYELAEAYGAELLARRRHSLGPNHIDVMEAAADLATDYQLHGKFTKSEPLAREAFEIDRNKRPDHWKRFRDESLLGASLAGQKKYAEAEPLLLEGYQGMVARKPRMRVEDFYYLDRSRGWIVQLYRAWGKSEEAARWRKK